MDRSDGVGAERSSNKQWAWEESRDNAGSRNGTKDLSDDNEQRSNPSYGSDESEPEGDLPRLDVSLPMRHLGTNY